MARGDIRNRIVLEGDEDVRRRLEALGRTGEQSMEQIGAAAADSNASLARLSDVSARFQNTFKAAGTALRDTAGNFQVLTSRGREFGAQLSEVADRIVPHFREVMALATAVSVGGLIELARRSADAAQRIQDGARALNISVQAYQDLGQAAARTGTSLETATGLFARLARAISEAASKQNDAVKDLAKAAFGDLEVSGVTVIRGVGAASGKTSSQVVSDIKRMAAAVGPVAERVQQEIKDAGATVVPTIGQITNNLVELASRNDAAGQKIRDMLNAAGQVAPALTLGEALDRLKSGSQDVGRAFELLGVKITDAKGQVLPLDQVMRQMATNLDKVNGKASTTASFAAIFGRGFKEVVPILEQVRDQASALGVSLTDLDTEISSRMIGSLAVLKITLQNIGTLLTNAFAPGITTIVDAITQAVTRNADTFRAWTTQLGNEVKPIAEDIARAIQNIGKAEEDQLPIQTAFVQNMLTTFTAIGQMFSILKTGLQDLIAVINVVLVPINALFGTQLTGGVVLATAAILQFLGAFKLLGAGIALFDALVSAFVTGPLVLLVQGLGGAGLLGLIGPGGALALAITAIIIVFTDWNKAVEGFTATWQGLQKLIASIGELLGPLGTNLRIIADLMKGDLTGAVNTFADAIVNLIPGLSLAVRLWEKLRQLMGGGKPAATAPIPPPTDETLGLGFASGGLVPGVGFGDKIRALLEPGEFVLRRSAVNAIGLDFLAMLNGGMNLMPRRTRFATGGLVTATGTGVGSDAGVHFHLNDKSFKLWTDRDVRNAMTREARRSKLLSAGPAPSSVG